MHWLVYGQTGAGKTSYLREVICKNALKAKKPVLIFDPFGDTWPDGVEVAPSKADFFKRELKISGGIIIYDEAGAEKKFDPDLERIAIQSRHRANLCVFAAQRPQQISPTVRGQCSHLVSFHLVPKDADFLADEFGVPELERAGGLPPLSYIYCSRWGKLKFSKVDFS